MASAIGQTAKKGASVIQRSSTHSFRIAYPLINNLGSHARSLGVSTRLPSIFIPNAPLPIPLSERFSFPPSPAITPRPASALRIVPTRRYHTFATDAIPISPSSALLVSKPNTSHIIFNPSETAFVSISPTMTHSSKIAKSPSSHTSTSSMTTSTSSHSAATSSATPLTSTSAITPSTATASASPSSGSSSPSIPSLTPSTTNATIPSTATASASPSSGSSSPSIPSLTPSTTNATIPSTATASASPSSGSSSPSIPSLTPSTTNATIPSTATASASPSSGSSSPSIPSPTPSTIVATSMASSSSAPLPATSTTNPSIPSSTNTSSSISSSVTLLDLDTLEAEHIRLEEKKFDLLSEKSTIEKQLKTVDVLRVLSIDQGISNLNKLKKIQGLSPDDLRKLEHLETFKDPFNNTELDRTIEHADLFRATRETISALMMQYQEQGRNILRIVNEKKKDIDCLSELARYFGPSVKGTVDFEKDPYVRALLDRAALIFKKPNGEDGLITTGKYVYTQEERETLLASLESKRSSIESFNQSEMTTMQEKNSASNAMQEMLSHYLKQLENLINAIVRNIRPN